MHPKDCKIGMAVRVLGTSIHGIIKELPIARKTHERLYETGTDTFRDYSTRTEYSAYIVFGDGSEGQCNLCYMQKYVKR